MAAVSFFVLYYWSVYHFETHLSFLDSLFLQLFSEFELPSWLMVILGVIVLFNLLEMVSSRLCKIRNYNFTFLPLVFLLNTCEDCTPTYPSTNDWKGECDIDTYVPDTADYTVVFSIIEGVLPSFYPADSVNIVCHVTRWGSLPHPFIPDTCYWSTGVIATLVGTTDENGMVELNFPIGFYSSGDYFVLEGYLEKAGYNRELFSSDQRFYYFNHEWLPCNSYKLRIEKTRRVKISKLITKYNPSP